MFKQIYINNLIIEGFKGYEDKTELALSDITKIIADNDKGKTSIGESITWAFLGTNLWGNDKADSDLLNNSSKKMEVTVKFTDGEKKYILKRRRGTTTSILLNNKTVKQAELTAMLGSKEIFLSIFNPEYFSSMGDKNGRDFLVSILPNIRAEEIFVEMDDYTIEYIREGLDLIHNNPNLYIQEKRAIIKELETDLVFNEGVLSKLDVTENIREMKIFDTKRLEELESVLDNLSLAKSEPNTTEFEKLVEEKNRLEKEVVLISSKEFSKVETIEEIKELAKLENHISLLEVEKYEIPEEIMKQETTLEAEYLSLREEYKKHQQITLEEGDKCPTCRTSINHTHLEMLKEEIAYELNQLSEKGKQKSIELGNFKYSIEIKIKEFNTIKEMKLKEYKENHKCLSEKIKKMEESNITNAKTFQEKKEKAISTLQNKIKTIEVEMNRIKQNYVDKEELRLKGINLKKEELKEQIFELRKEKAQIDAYNLEINFLQENSEKNLVEKDKLLKENSEINEKISLYNTQIEICKQYTSNKVKLLSDILHSNLKHVTIELEKIVKSTAELKDCFEINYKGRKYKVLSRSEVIKVGFEMSNLIRKITNYNFPIFVDNAESITRYEVPENVQIIETKVVEGKDITILSDDKEEQLSIAI